MPRGGVEGGVTLIISMFSVLAHLSKYDQRRQLHTERVMYCQKGFTAFTHSSPLKKKKKR